MIRGLLGLVAATCMACLVAGAPVEAATKKAVAEDAASGVVKKKKKKQIGVVSVKRQRKAVADARDDAKLKQKKKLAAVTTKPGQRRNNFQASSDTCSGFFSCMFKNSGRRDSSGLLSSGKNTRKLVAWKETKYKPGSIVVRTPERALYYILPNGEAMRYKVGVGREGFQWGGNARISRKAEWPDWRPPQEMIEREAEKGHIIPEFMEGGPNNPLGARALYIGSSIYRIHGTNNASSIGGAVSSGCIRMMNADVIDLYGRVKVGAKVYVYQ